MKKSMPFRSHRPRSSQPSNVYRRATSAGGFGSKADDNHCGIKAECGACKYVNLDYKTSLDEKHKAGVQILEEAGVIAGARVLAPTPSPKPFGYRSLFKLAVREAEPGQVRAPIVVDGESTEREARFAIGLFEQGSHKVVDMDRCPLHAASLARLIPDLRRELELSPLTPYSEATHSGQVRYVAARTAHLTGEVMLTFVVTESLRSELKTLVSNLQRLGHRINSAHMNIHAERGNAIFGPETVRIAGADRLRERVLDLDFEVGPTSFFQINPWQAMTLYRRVEQIAGPAAPSAVAWDLYCGIGQMSLVLARLGYKVLGVEENPKSIEDAGDNARRNRLETQTHFVAARVEDVKDEIPAWASTPELIVVNPSRRGLAEVTREELADLLAARPKTRLVYVSCSVDSLARDLKDLTERTGFRVRQVEAFDMFAQTDGLEWLVVLTH